jgi:hypothetical protein
MIATVPRHRWFQFKLSTWFVLAGILAWALAQIPLWSEIDELIVLIETSVEPYGFGGIKMPRVLGITETVWYWKLTTILTKLRWQLLALLAFVAWKAAWLIVARRRQQIV